MLSKVEGKPHVYEIKIRLALSLQVVGRSFPWMNRAIDRRMELIARSPPSKKVCRKEGRLVNAIASRLDAGVGRTLFLTLFSPNVR